MTIDTKIVPGEPNFGYYLSSGHLNRFRAGEQPDPDFMAAFTTAGGFEDKQAVLRETRRIFSPAVGSKLLLPLFTEKLFPPLLWNFDPDSIEPPKHYHADFIRDIDASFFENISFFPDLVEKDDNCLVFNGFFYLINSVLQKDYGQHWYSLLQTSSNFSQLELGNYFKPYIRGIGVLNPEVPDISNLIIKGMSKANASKLGYNWNEFWNYFRDDFNACFRVKKTTPEEYYKALLIDRRPVLFGIRDKIGDFYMFQHSLFFDLDTLFESSMYYNQIQDKLFSIHPKMDAFEMSGMIIPPLDEKVIDAHLSPAIDWLLKRQSLLREHIGDSSGFDVELPIPMVGYGSSTSRNIKLEDFDYLGTLNKRVKGGEAGKYSRPRLGSNGHYAEFSKDFIEFSKPLREVSDVILPTLYLGDILPLGFILDSAEACIGNPFMMYSNLLSHPLIEKYGAKQGLKDKVLKKYAEMSKADFDIDEMYQRAEVVISIYEIGAHYNRLLSGLDQEHIPEGVQLVDTLEYNLRGLKHYIGLLQQGLSCMANNSPDATKLLESSKSYFADTELLETIAKAEKKIRDGGANKWNLYPTGLMETVSKYA